MEFEDSFFDDSGSDKEVESGGGNGTNREHYQARICEDKVRNKWYSALLHS